MGILLKSENILYDLSDHSYDIATHCYTGVPLQDYDIANLLSTSTLTVNKIFQNITIGTDTFRPIDKINNFNIISDKQMDVSIKSLKDNAAMLVMRDDILIDETLELFINYFKAEFAGTIKIILSFDGGETWETFNNGFQQISIFVPTKEYNLLSKEELDDWDNAKDIIIEQGFDCSIMEKIPFKSVPISSIRFVFVLQQPSYPASIEFSTSLKSFYRNLKEAPHYIRVPSNEITSNLKFSKIDVIPKFDSIQMYINALIQMKTVPISPIVGERLDTPILIMNFDKTEQTAILEWDKIENAKYYKIYINNICVSENFTFTSYSYITTSGEQYDFCVRAFSDNLQILPSKFSNTEKLIFTN